MADVKENDLPKIASYSDIKEVRLVKTDGTSTGMAIDTFINQIAEKVARVDGFASVVAELIGLSDTIMFRAWGEKDANELLNTGFCINMNTMKNVPFSYGTLVNINSANTHVVQLYYAADTSNTVYYRNYVNSNWTGWRNL